MFLSKVRVACLELDRRALFELVRSDAYASHELLWKLFPGTSGRSFLFRQELEVDDPRSKSMRGLPLFYVLSELEPSPVAGLLDCEVREFNPRLRVGQRLRFRLRANPVVSRQVSSEGRSTRHDVLMNAKRSARLDGVVDPRELSDRMDDAAQAWLADESRSDRGGYKVLGLPELSAYRQHAIRRKGGEIRFSSIDYTGDLEVQDESRFLRMLSEGIGRSRAFGCGMWMIRPA